MLSDGSPRCSSTMCNCVRLVKFQNINDSTTNDDDDDNDGSNDEDE